MEFDSIIIFLYIVKNEKRPMKFTYRIIKVGEKLYLASCPQLRGCHIQASDETQASERIKEAIRIMVNSFKQHNERVSING